MRNGNADGAILCINQMWDWKSGLFGVATRGFFGFGVAVNYTRSLGRYLALPFRELRKWLAGAIQEEAFYD